MTPRERVQAALCHAQPDFTPCDYFTTPEIHRALLAHFGLREEPSCTATLGGSMPPPPDSGVRTRLGVDIQYVNPPYVGPPPPTFDDGSSMNLWGIRRRPMANEYGDYAEPVELPYAAWTTVEEVDRFPWPDPDRFDYDAIPALCAKYPDLAIGCGGSHVQDFLNGVAYGRGVEQVFFDVAAENPVYLRIVERRHRFYMAYIERILDAAGGRIDFVHCGDDFGGQHGLLISPASFDKLFAAKKKELFDLAHAFGAKISHHCCGSSRALLPRLIECGMDALQTVQPKAAGMDPYGLKRDFGDRLVLHGAVDAQGWLQSASPKDIATEVNRLMDEVGAGGGFILAPSHNIQPDTPIANVLALYDAVARRRGKTVS